MVNIIIILGNSRPEILNKRLNRGIEEFNKIKHPYEDDEEVYGIHNYIFLSGGGRGIKVNNKMYKNESEYMFEYVSKIIDPKYIVTENISNSTVENLINCFNIILKKYPSHDIFSSSINITICTSSYHLKRTIVLAKLLNKEGFNLKFIHTNEIISEEENKRELKHLDSFMNYYCNNMLN